MFKSSKTVSQLEEDESLTKLDNFIDENLLESTW
jgi:hypothetical protein